jgi:ATP-dependent Clp protease ATP-binding subunit ClpC
MFERFTERARQVVVLAQDEARLLKHNYIGTEHLLLGLLAEEEGIAARMLESIGIRLEDARADVGRIIGVGTEVTPGQIPFTPRAKKVLELSLREAISLGQSYIGTEHILLGLAREGEGVANRILLEYGADSEDLRNRVIRALGGQPPDEEEPADQLAAFQPVSPPFSPEFAQELQRLRDEKEQALEAQDFECAARLRDRERELRLRGLHLQRAWETRSRD